MDISNSMKFGVFMAPFHRVGENPTLALEMSILWTSYGFQVPHRQLGRFGSPGWPC